MIVALLLGSCSKSDDNTVQPVSLDVNVSYAGDDSLLGLSKSSVKITLTNMVNGQVYTANTEVTGLAKFESLTPGNYTVTATKSYTPEAFVAESNVSIENDVTYNGNVSESITTNKSVSLSLVAGQIGDLVFKQIYYAGSNTSTGASFRDQFVEIYNNSNKIIYLDSLYVGSTLAPNTKLSADGKSYDWSKSVDYKGVGDANKDYLYFRYLFMIPGSGKDHPLNPGESIVIAQTALNHAEPYTDNSGKVQGITDPTQTIDLSKADFETYLVDYLAAATTYRWDIDNPMVPNVNVIYVSSGKDWVMDATGREDFVMFKSTELNNNWPLLLDPEKSANEAMQVPSKYVIDAVEILTPLETNRVPKRLPLSMDATGTFVSGGQYSSNSLVRKTVKTVNGRRILKDTNNSTEDFTTKAKADPSKKDASF